MDIRLPLTRRPITPDRRAERAAKRFLRYFPKGFSDPKYFAWERGYKLEAHQGFTESVGSNYASLLRARRYKEIAAHCVRLESRTNLLFSFEKMALRDAVKESAGAKTFAVGLFELLHGSGTLARRFDNWCAAVAALPRKQTRVLTHPVVTIFPFLADPVTHIFVKPLVTKTAAERLGYTLEYRSTPSWEVYGSVLEFASWVSKRLDHLRPRDMIDIQSFLWVTGSSEYD